MAASSAGVSASNGSQPEATESSQSSTPATSGGGLSDRGGRPQGDDILSAVDGEGAAPLFGVEEIERARGRSAAKKPAKKEKGETERSGHVLRAEQAEGIPTSGESVDPFAGLESAFQRELQPPQDPDADLTAPDGQQPSEREQNRMQVLANRTRQAEERAQAAESGLHEAQQRFEVMQGQIGEHLAGVMQQNARLQAQVEMLMQGQRREALDPAEQIEQDLIGKATAKARQGFDPEIQALRKEISDLRHGRDQDRRTAEINTNRERYKAEGQAAALNTVLKGLPESEAQQLLPGIIEDVLATAWGKRTSAAEAAKIVRERYLRFGMAFIRAESKLRRESKDRGEAMPKPPPAARGGGSGEADPTHTQIRAAGFENHLQWEFAGKPPIARS